MMNKKVAVHGLAAFHFPMAEIEHVIVLFCFMTSHFTLMSLGTMKCH